MSRTDQLNSILREELAHAINRNLELDGVLVTVSEVFCTPDMREARVSVSVLPEKLAGTALKRLRRISGDLAHDIRKRVKIRRIPMLIWEFDERPSRAAALEQVISHLS